jgi:hypothetical protein
MIPIDLFILLLNQLEPSDILSFQLVNTKCYHVSTKYIQTHILDWLLQGKLPHEMMWRWWNEIQGYGHDLIMIYPGLPDKVIQKLLENKSLIYMCSKYQKIPLNLLERIEPEEICWQKQIFYHDRNLFVLRMWKHLNMLFVLQIPLEESTLEHLIQVIPSISWLTISKYQKLSYGFIQKYKNHLHEPYLKKYQINYSQLSF